MIEDAHRLGEQRVVAARFLFDPAQHGLEPTRVGDRDATDVEEVHRGADGSERGILVEPEAREQHLESYAVLYVRGLGAVEIEAHRLLRAFARASDARDARL